MIFEKRKFDEIEWTWRSDDIITWEWFINYSKSYRTTPYHWPEQLLEYCKNFKCIIQAGGNAGMYPKFYAKHFDQVHTFEPDNDWFYCLNKNVTEENVTKYNLFLGDKLGSAKIEVNPKMPDNLGAIRTKLGDSDDLKNVITIDSLNLSPNMIHLDVEGFEYNVLKGAKETIIRSKPIIVIETQDHFKTYGTNLLEIESFLEDLGYHPIRRYKTDCVYAYKD